MQCEYLDNPLGIDGKTPRLGWKLSSDPRGVMQKAYQVQVFRADQAGEPLWELHRSQ